MLASNVTDRYEILSIRQCPMGSWRQHLPARSKTSRFRRHAAIRSGWDLVACDLHIGRMNWELWVNQNTVHPRLAANRRPEMHIPPSPMHHLTCQLLRRS